MFQRQAQALGAGAVGHHVAALEVFGKHHVIGAADDGVQQLAGAPLLAAQRQLALQGSGVAPALLAKPQAKAGAIKQRQHQQRAQAQPPGPQALLCLNIVQIDLAEQNPRRADHLGRVAQHRQTAKVPRALDDAAFALRRAHRQQVGVLAKGARLADHALVGGVQKAHALALAAHHGKSVAVARQVLRGQHLVQRGRQVGVQGHHAQRHTVCAQNRQRQARLPGPIGTRGHVQALQLGALQQALPLLRRQHWPAIANHHQQLATLVVHAQAAPATVEDDHLQARAQALQHVLVAGAVGAGGAPLLQQLLRQRLPGEEQLGRGVAGFEAALNVCALLFGQVHQVFLGVFENARADAVIGRQAQPTQQHGEQQHGQPQAPDRCPQSEGGAA